MSFIYKLVGVGDYTYKEKAKVKSKEICKKKNKGVVGRGKSREK